MKLREYFLKLKCLPRLLALTAYILIGAAIFVKLEKTEEPNMVVANRMLKAVQENLSLVFGVNITEQEFNSVVESINEAVTIQARHDWTYWKAVDFVVVALTTIGYGDIVPCTPMGQGVFIIYALIGLPLTMVTLKYTGEFLIVCYQELIIAVEKIVFRKQEHVHLKVKCFILSIFMFVHLHLCSTIFLCVFSELTFIQGLYASFVTLSTIGFGDYRFRLDHLANCVGPVGTTIVIIMQLPTFLVSLTFVSSFLLTTAHMAGKVRQRVTVRNRRNNATENRAYQEEAENGKSETPGFKRNPVNPSRASI